jgi:hypothetical protein
MFDHVIAVDSRSRTVFDSCQEILPEVIDWLMDNCGLNWDFDIDYGTDPWGEQLLYSKPIFSFIHPADALLFKLTWGG